MRSPPTGPPPCRSGCALRPDATPSQAPLQIAFHEAALGPTDGGEADTHGSGNLLVAAGPLRPPQKIRPLEVSGGVLAAAEHRRQFVALGLAQFDPITYIHALPPCRRPGRTQR